MQFSFTYVQLRVRKNNFVNENYIKMVTICRVLIHVDVTVTSFS